MLTGITLENFKAFKAPRYIPIKPITLIFGPNSSGKSSIIHSLAFLKFVYETKGYCDPDVVDFGWGFVHLGSWRNLVHGHNLDSSVKITLHGEDEDSITWTFERGEDSPTVASFLIKKGGRPIARGQNLSSKLIRWDVQIHVSHGLIQSYKDLILKNLHNQPWKGSISRPFSLQFDSWLGGEWIPLPEHLRSDEVCVNLFPAHLADLYISKHFFEEDFPEKVFNDLLISITEPDPSSCHAIFNSLFKEMDWRAPDRELENSFKSMLYVGGSRNLPTGLLTRRSLPSSPDMQPWLALIDNTSDEHGVTARNELNSMLQILELDYSVRTRIRRESILIQNEEEEAWAAESEEPYVSQEELVFQDRKKVLHPIHALGYGIGKVLPNLVAMASADVELLILEEPESNIHPRLQSALGDLVIRSSSIGNKVSESQSYDDDFSYSHEEITKNKNIMIETHSEHLILRILRRIRETTRGTRPEGHHPIRPDDVAVLYVEPGAEGAIVRELRVNEQGRFIDEWPNGFFEERFNEEF